MDSLPSETLHRIFQHFECTIPFDNWEQGYIADIECPPPRELITLSQVCRRFRDIARPLIYRTVAFQWREDNHDKFVDAFLRTLCADPSIGQGIQDLHVDDWSRYSNYETKDLARELLAIPENLNERQRRWLQRWLAAEIEWPNEDILLILLILTPRLRMLDCGQTVVRGGIGAYLSGSKDAEDYFFEKTCSGDRLIDADEDDGQNDDDDDDDDDGDGDDDDDDGAESGIDSRDEDEPAIDPPSSEAGQRSAITPSHPLAELTDLRFRHDFGNGFESVSNIEGVLLHPGLESLRLFAFTWAQSDVKKMKWSEFPSNLRSLQLKATIVDAAGLKDILSRCKQLRSLHIVLATIGRMDSQDDGEGIDLDKMGAVLRKYGQNIESFDFESEGFRGYFCPDGHLGPALNRLKALRQLKISTEDIGEFNDNEDEVDGLPVSLRNMLPPTLESIHIRRSDGPGCPGVPRALLMDKTLGALRKVEVEASDNSDPENLIVPGWIKSERVDLINRYETDMKLRKEI